MISSASRISRREPRLSADLDASGPREVDTALVLWSRRPWNERDTRRSPTQARTRSSMTARHRAARPRERKAGAAPRDGEALGHAGFIAIFEGGYRACFL